MCLYIFQIQFMCVFGVGEFGGSGVSPIQLCAIDVHGRLYWVNFNLKFIICMPADSLAPWPEYTTHTTEY